MGLGSEFRQSWDCKHEVKEAIADPSCILLVWQLQLDISWGQWETDYLVILGRRDGGMLGLSRREGVFIPNCHLSDLEILALHKLLYLTPRVSSVLGFGDIQGCRLGS